MYFHFCVCICICVFVFICVCNCVCVLPPLGSYSVDYCSLLPCKISFLGSLHCPSEKFIIKVSINAMDWWWNYKQATCTTTLVLRIHSLLKIPFYKHTLDHGWVASRYCTFQKWLQYLGLGSQSSIIMVLCGCKVHAHICANLMCKICKRRSGDIS